MEIVPLTLIVTAPVAPDTETFVPATILVTPVFVTETAPVALVFVLNPELVVRAVTPVLVIALPNKEIPVPAVYVPAGPTAPPPDVTAAKPATAVPNVNVKLLISTNCIVG